jgi:hypothetical protein
MQPKESTLMTMCVAALVFSQADEFVLTLQILAENFWLAFQEMVILRINYQTGRHDVFTQPFQGVTFNCAHKF